MSVHDAPSQRRLLLSRMRRFVKRMALLPRSTKEGLPHEVVVLVLRERQRDAEAKRAHFGLLLVGAAVLVQRGVHMLAVPADGRAALGVGPHRMVVVTDTVPAPLVVLEARNVLVPGTYLLRTSATASPFTQYAPETPT